MSESDTPPGTRHAAMWGAALVLLVVAVYWPALSGSFVSDDEVHVENNAALESTQGLSDIWFKWGAVPQYYPIAHTAFWLEHQVFESRPTGYHAVNIALHALAALLLWRLLQRLAVPWAWLAAAVFALHPVQVESVAWISELKNVLSCVFVLGSMLAYFRFAPPSRNPASRRDRKAGGTKPRSPCMWRRC